ncbi:fatty acid desaturase domain-containing protein [Hirsutella rhossiliensis]|uniref:Delta 8-(E)-sphingolipid desaturase n=1 Tax=Hirsutella rhossiliensis TaxID=111463 RepID=A0A9P8SJG8_9HYPO|nr:fatty acid desaturase domain-containing protein [Hirsutella rhossiliensis]KAH0964189.1 fatty acid desaturase domain-containing protein [Hirsutella rhossiliensis]
MDRDQVLSQQAVEAMIANGHTIVVFQDYILRLDSWLAKHPGGSLAILHMVGRDATDEITAYHSAATLRTMKAYRIGRKPAGLWINKTPPIRGGIFHTPEDSTRIVDDVPGDSSSDDTSDHSSPTPPTSRSPSVNGLELKDDFEGAVRRRLMAKGSDGPGEPSATSPAEYVDWAVQQGIEDGLRDYPSLDLAVQQDIVGKYRELHQRVVDEGLYDCPYQEYAKEMGRYSCLFIGSLVALHHEWYVTSAVLLGLFWHQIMFTAHDAGHRAITHIFAVDTLIGMFIADFCCGLSIGWWKSSHNVHHLVTNQPEHDPDIQNLPLFAISPSFFKSITSTYYDNFVIAWDAAADLLVPYQKYTYYVVMAIARFNLYVLSWLHVFSPKAPSLGHSKAWWIRPTEIAFMCCYWFLFGYCLLWRTLPTWTVRVVFVLVSHIVTMPLHVQINLSHWGMSTSDLGESESFAQRQLRTTMDVDCPAWLDFIHGGLQFQAVHHLFPRVPRHNLRRVQTLVKEFCQGTGIPYSILGFVDGNRKVLGRLQEVSDQLKMLVDCQKSMAESGECKLH